MAEKNPRWRKEEEETPQTPLRQVLDALSELGFALLVVIFVFTFLFRLITVSGTSMQPNFMDGDRVVVSMIGNSYKTGDVIVAVNVLDDPIIKRVIATEGQTVRIDYEAGVVYVDDHPVDETRFGLENGITRAVYTSLEKTELPATVPEGCVCVLGDNRRVSEDSR